VVDVVEPLGAEILLDVAVAGQSVVCRVEPTVKARAHDKIRMAFVPERIHFFDSKTEAVLKEARPGPGALGSPGHSRRPGG
jgi:multiple sugar transport system ATP-binding protein